MTTARQLAYLLTFPLRLVVMLAVGCGRAVAVCVGTAWTDSRGGFHWLTLPARKD